MFTPKLKLEHADSRGEIYSIELPDGHELMLIHSTAGAFRGGHSRSCGERVLILSGQMIYHLVEKTEVCGPGSVVCHADGVIHMGDFPEDNWLVEYKLAKKGEWTQEDYEPYRERVRASQGTVPAGQDPHPSERSQLWPGGD